MPILFEELAYRIQIYSVFIAARLVSAIIDVAAWIVVIPIRVCLRIIWIAWIVRVVYNVSLSHFKALPLRLIRSVCKYVVVLILYLSSYLVAISCFKLADVRYYVAFHVLQFILHSVYLSVLQIKYVRLGICIPILAYL